MPEIHRSTIRGGRGLGRYGRPFKSRCHGEVRVQDSSAATSKPCCWIFTERSFFTERSYSNEPEKNAPHLHLSFDDAVKLRDRLTAFIGDGNL